MNAVGKFSRFLQGPAGKKAFKGDPFDNPEEISTPYQYF